MFNHQGESVPSGSEERLVGESHLNVGVFTYVLNAVLHQPEQISGEHEKNLY